MINFGTIIPMTEQTTSRNSASANRNRMPQRPQTEAVPAQTRPSCAMPNCLRSPVPSASDGATGVALYCGDPEHNPAAAWRERQELKAKLTGMPVDARPIDAARERASEIKGTVTGMVEHLLGQFGELADALKQTADPEAAAAQVEAVAAEAAEKVAEAHARVARAERAHWMAESERAQADAAAIEAAAAVAAMTEKVEQASAAMTLMSAERDTMRTEFKAQGESLVVALKSVEELTGRFDATEKSLAAESAARKASENARLSEVERRVKATEAAAADKLRADEATAALTESQTEARRSAAALASGRHRLEALTAQLAAQKSEAERSAAAADAEHEQLMAQITELKAAVVAGEQARSAAEAKVESMRTESSRAVEGARAEAASMVDAARKEATAKMDGARAEAARLIEAARNDASHKVEAARAQNLAAATAHAQESAAAEAALTAETERREAAEAMIAEFKAKAEAAEAAKVEAEAVAREEAATAAAIRERIEVLTVERDSVDKAMSVVADAKDMLAAKLEEMALKLAVAERARGAADAKATGLESELAKSVERVAVAEAAIERMREQVVDLRSQFAVTSAVLGGAQYSAQ